MFFKKKSDGYTYLIAGLGNPESKYNGTRHNIGFEVMDRLKSDLGCGAVKHKFNSEIFTAEIGNEKCLLQKPLTYMNNSGEAISAAANFYKIPPERIIVISDDISLDVGQIRIRRKGSDGGHNGLKSIIALLNSQNFIRVKLGVGKKPHPDYDLVSWVLGKFAKNDLPTLTSTVSDAANAVKCIVTDNVDTAMNKFNR